MAALLASRGEGGVLQQPGELLPKPIAEFGRQILPPGCTASLESPVQRQLRIVASRLWHRSEPPRRMGSRRLGF
jgi:hypothetical protein